MSDISFPSSPSGGDTYTYNNITFTYDGEKWTAKAPVTTTSTYGDANVAAYASSQGFIDLTDISVTSNSPSGNGSLSYNNGSGVFTFTPADASGSGGGSYANSDVEAYLSGGDGIDFVSGVIDVDSTVVRTSGTQSIAGAKTFSDGIILDGIGSNIQIGATLTALRFTQANVDIHSVADELFIQNSNNSVLSNVQIINNGNVILNPGNTIIHGITYPKTDGTSGQVLQTDGNGTLSFATVSGGGTDSQDLTLSGNVISLTGQSGNVDLTSLLATQPTTVTADSTDGTTLLLDGGDASGLNSTGGNVDINSGTGALQSGYVNIGQSSQGVNIGANSSTSIDVTGPLTVNNQLIIEDGVSEKFSSLTGATGVVTHDCDNGHIFYHSSISANFTANFTNLGLSTNYGTTLTLILDQGATARIPSAVQISGSAQTINWQGGSAPTGTNNGVDAVSFTILRVSGNYVVLGQLVDFT